MMARCYFTRAFPESTKLSGRCSDTGTKLRYSNLLSFAGLSRIERGLWWRDTNPTPKKPKFQNREQNPK
jgi:hypothetical protein